MSAIPDLLPGTLDLLILRLLTADSMHGYGLAQRLKLLSKDVLQVGESSLYPALQRLLLNGYVDAEWAPSERAQGIHANHRGDSTRAGDGMTMPTFFRRLRARIKYWNNAEELEKELDLHRDLAAAAFAADGTSPREARWKAARLLGNTTMAREDARAVWVSRWIEHFMQDLWYALRGFRKHWTFTLAAVTMLALGLGVAAGAFNVANGLFFRGWQVAESHNLFVAKPKFDPSGGRVDDGLSYGAYRHFLTNGRTADYFAFKMTFMRLTPARDERGSGIVPTGLFVSDNFFDAMRIPLLMGTPPRAADVTREPTAVISFRLWQRAFGGDPQILGRTGWSNGNAFTIVGVTSQSFEGIIRAIDIFAPMWAGVGLNAGSSARQAVANESSCCVDIAGRVRTGASYAAVEQELDVLAAQYRDSVQQTRLKIEITDTSVGAQMLGRGNLAAMFLLAFAAVLFLLVLTCANVGNLVLARNLRRQQEIITRLALGASRSRLVRQWLTEGLVLSAIAGALALAAAATVPAIIRASSPQAVPSQFVVDWRVSLLTFGGVVLVCLLVSLAPAVRTTRVAWRGSAAMATARTSGLRGALLAIQIAIATVLILSATLLVRGIQFGLSAPSDFAFQTTTAATVSFPGAATAERQKALTAELISAVHASPTPIGMSARSPVSQHASVPTSVREPDSNIDYSVEYFPMSAAAATVLQVPLATGRWASDDAGRNEAVINETLARQIWNNVSPIGQTLTLDYTKKRYTISGVTRDTHVVALGPIGPLIHTTVDADSMPLLLAPKTAAGIEALRQIAASVDPAISLSLLSLTDAAKGTTGDSLAGAALASSVGAAALLMAMIGSMACFRI